MLRKENDSAEEENFASVYDAPEFNAESQNYVMDEDVSEEFNDKEIEPEIVAEEEEIDESLNDFADSSEFEDEVTFSSHIRSQ